MSMAEIKIQEFKLMRLYFGQDFLPCPIRTECDLSFIPKELFIIYIDASFPSTFARAPQSRYASSACSY